MTANCPHCTSQVRRFFGNGANRHFSSSYPVAKLYRLLILTTYSRFLLEKLIVSQLEPAFVTAFKRAHHSFNEGKKDKLSLCLTKDHAMKTHSLLN
jgi:hypothetical protein